MRMGRFHALLALALALTSATATAQTGEPDSTGETAAPGVAATSAPVNEPPPPPAASTESNCSDGRDDDGDEMIDCADADCFEAPNCLAGGNSERNDQRCGDWIDNDGDGLVDCEDSDCTHDPVTVCHGSAREVRPEHQADDHEEDLPQLTGNMAAEDLIGNYGDNHGERDDFSCSDGIDNDADGRVDCQDFGCRFDPLITVCTSSPGYRFGVVAGVGFTYDFEADRDIRTAGDVNFTRLQMRVLGQIPFIENSFFLINFRGEKSFRMTFATFQVPIGDRGHFVALNSGSGTLSNALIISAAKQPLLDPAFYLVNAFEQGNGAVLEVGGPLVPSGRVNYRVFAGGGAGFSNGNVGGRFFRQNNENFTYVAGAQLQFNVVGHFSRFDSPLLYTSVPLGLGFWAGAKFDQRATERYPAANVSTWFRYGRFLLRGEAYGKYVLDFGGSMQLAWNAQMSLLLWPKRMFLAADVGQYIAEEYSDLPADSDLRPQIIRDEFRFRAALHFWWYRNIGLLSLVYDEAHLEDDGRVNTEETERQLRIEVQYRF